jgi:hypothetical protein
MHCFVNKKLPFSFNDLWITNRERNPNSDLRNADDFFIPSHKMASLKRLPLFSFPKVWNEEPERKNIVNPRLYIKTVKGSLLSAPL